MCQGLDTISWGCSSIGFAIAVVTAANFLSGLTDGFMASVVGGVFGEGLAKVIFGEDSEPLTLHEEFADLT